MMSDMNCPYCEEDIDAPDDCYNSEQTYEHECPYCEKKFTFTLEYLPQYYPIQADCLNGEPHAFKERHCCPAYVGVGVYICGDCDTKETRWQERLDKLKALEIADWEKPIVAKLISQAEKELAKEQPK